MKMMRGRSWEGQSVEKSEMYQLSEHAYLSEVYKMSEVCKITRTIQNRFDMGGRYVHCPDKMRGWREGDDHHGRRRSDMLFF